MFLRLIEKNDTKVILNDQRGELFWFVNPVIYTSYAGFGDYYTFDNLFVRYTILKGLINSELTL